MATEYSNCPTCKTQLATVHCDNCQAVIPNDVTPAVSGRVWDPTSQEFLLVTLCSNCEDLPIKLLTVVTASNPPS